MTTDFFCSAAKTDQYFRLPLIAVPVNTKMFRKELAGKIINEKGTGNAPSFQSISLATPKYGNALFAWKFYKHSSHFWLLKYFIVFSPIMKKIRMTQFCLFRICHRGNAQVHSIWIRSVRSPSEKSHLYERRNGWNFGLFAACVVNLAVR